MVLKGSKAELWLQSVQLSPFSLIPALLPILYAAPPPDSRGFFLDLFRHFGAWAWATVAIQVIGGLVTAMVIKYSDNILKVATSLSIVLWLWSPCSISELPHHLLPVRRQCQVQRGCITDLPRSHGDICAICKKLSLSITLQPCFTHCS